jgi:hypothetical protein
LRLDDRRPKTISRPAGERNRGGIVVKLALFVLSALVLAAPAHAQLAPPNAAGVTYGHVHLSVSDIELHKKLWVEHFGGTVVQKGTLTAVKLPNMLIAFRATAPTGPSGTFRRSSRRGAPPATRSRANSPDRKGSRTPT